MRFVKIALARQRFAHCILCGTGGYANTAAPLPCRFALPPRKSATQRHPARLHRHHRAYSVHESTDADGITVREYVLPSNVVFAVTWDGPVRPDMRALLGSYFPNFVSAGEERLRGTGTLILSNGELQIESAGRPGHFLGMAYIPRLMPADLRANNLQ